MQMNQSNTHDEFDDFVLNFEQVLRNTIARNRFSVLVNDNFNARAAK